VESDARSVRQFLLTTFDGIGAAGAEKILSATKMGPRQSPSKLKEQDIAQLYMAMKNVNLTEGQTMQVLRYANRVPLQFQPAACAICRPSAVSLRCFSIAAIACARKENGARSSYDTWARSRPLLRAQGLRRTQQEGSLRPAAARRQM